MQEPSPDRLWAMYVMEFIGSYIILMIIQLAHFFNFSAFAISLSFLVAVVISAKISGANLNAAVTCMLFLNQVKTEGVTYYNYEKFYKYIFAQILGGLAAGFTAAFIYGPNTLVQIQLDPSISLSQAFILEFIYTLILCLVVAILCSDAYKHTHDPTIIGALVSGSVFLAAMSLGDKTGGVINPSIAISAILARKITNSGKGEIETLWLYIIAPLCAAFIAHMMYDKTIRPALMKQNKKQSEVRKSEILLQNVTPVA